MHLQQFHSTEDFCRSCLISVARLKRCRAGANPSDGSAGQTTLVYFRDLVG